MNMKMNKKAITLFMTVCMLISALPATTLAQNTLSITYAENPEPIFKNPGKGFIRYSAFEYAGSDPLLLQKTFDYANVGYGRYCWDDLEPEEGKFNWELIDKDVEFCDSQGMRYAFGIMGISQTSRYPKWLFEYDVAYKEFVYTPTGDRGKMPYYDDPIYLEKRDNFFKALAEHYDGDDRIAYIDMRLWGNYGEGHFGSMANTVPTPTKEMEIRLMESYTKYFKNTQLVGQFWIQDDGPYDELIKAGNIGLRADSIGFRQRNANSAQGGVHGRGPAVFETAGSWSKITTGAYNGIVWSDEFSANECRNARVSYYEIGEWGIETENYVRDNEEMIKTLANQIGYHFTLKGTRIPASAKSGEIISVSTDWTNTGLAYLFDNCNVDFAILDENNNVISHYKTDIVPTRKWSPDVELITETAQITLSDLNDGKYKLAVGLFKNYKDDTADYRIGNFDRTAKGWYVIADAFKSDDSYTFSYNRDSINVNGIEIKENVLSENGIRYVPLASMFGALGSRIKEDEKEIVVAYEDDYVISFNKENGALIVNGVTEISSDAIIIKGGLAYISEKAFNVFPMINYSSDGKNAVITDMEYVHKTKDYEVGVVPNGSFESNNNSWSYDGSVCRTTDEFAVDGKYSMKISNADGQNTLSTSIRGEQEQEYKLKFSVKTDAPISYEVRLRYNTILAKGEIPASENFTEYSVLVDFTDPGHNRGMRFTHKDPVLTFTTVGGGTYAYIDAVKLEKHKHYSDIELDPENLVDDYDFEVARHGWVESGTVLNEMKIVADNPHTGEYCLKVNDSDNWSGLVKYVTDALRKSGAGKYKIEYYARTDKGETMDLYLLFGERYNHNYPHISGEGFYDWVAPINENWQKVEYTVDLKQDWIDGMSNCVFSIAYCNDTDVGKNFYLDSVKLIKID